MFVYVKRQTVIGGGCARFRSGYMPIDDCLLILLLYRLMIDENGVNHAAHEATDIGCKHGNECIIVTDGEDARTPACDGGEHPRTDIACRVEREARGVTQAHRDDHQTAGNHHTLHSVKGHVVWVAGDQDQNEEQSGADDLRRDGRRGADIKGRVGRKDVGRTVVAQDLTRSTIKLVQRRVNDRIKQCGASEGTEELREKVNGDLACREPRKDPKGECHGWVDVGPLDKEMRLVQKI